MLKATGAPNRVIDKFREQAEFVLEKRPQQSVDNVAVSSSYGEITRRGAVELTVNETRTQMDTAKARQIGLMLLQAAEAAESDEIFIRFLEQKFRIPDDLQLRGAILLDLREIRQGSREIVNPS